MVDVSIYINLKIICDSMCSLSIVMLQETRLKFIKNVIIRDGCQKLQGNYFFYKNL